MALKCYHYVRLLLLALPHIFKWIPQPAKKHDKKESEKFADVLGFSQYNYQVFGDPQLQHMQLHFLGNGDTAALSTSNFTLDSPE